MAEWAGMVQREDDAPCMAMGSLCLWVQEGNPEAYAS